MSIPNRRNENKTKHSSIDFCIACTLCFLLSDMLVNSRSSRGKEFLKLIKTTLHFFVSEYLSSGLFGGNKQQNVNVGKKAVMEHHGVYHVHDIKLFFVHVTVKQTLCCMHSDNQPLLPKSYHKSFNLNHKEFSSTFRTVQGKTFLLSSNNSLKLKSLRRS